MLIYDYRSRNVKEINANKGGNNKFIRSALKLLYGNTLTQKIASIQTLSGTGACYIAAKFLKNQLGVPGGLGVLSMKHDNPTQTYTEVILCLFF